MSLSESMAKWQIAMKQEVVFTLLIHSCSRGQGSASATAQSMLLAALTDVFHPFFFFSINIVMNHLVFSIRVAVILANNRILLQVTFYPEFETLRLNISEPL